MTVRRLFRLVVLPAAVAASGCMNAVTSLTESDESKAAAPAKPADPAPAADPAPRPETPPAPEEGGSHVNKKTRELLNAREATQDPNWKVVTNEVSGSDPLSVAGSVYNRAAPIAGSAGIVQWIKAEQALNGSWPTYASLMKMMEQNPGLELPMLKEYQSYGYDETTGEIVILEHKEKKAARYRELGLPVEEG